MLHSALGMHKSHSKFDFLDINEPTYFQIFLSVLTLQAQLKSQNFNCAHKILYLIILLDIIRVVQGILTVVLVDPTLVKYIVTMSTLGIL